MRYITVHDCNGIAHNEPVYTARELPILECLKGIHIVNKRYDRYYNIPCAFDIETTSINADKPYGFMYQWQFCIGSTVCFGRTWEEFELLLSRLKQCAAINVKFVIYVHYLPFEFQFMNQFIGNITSVFAREKRKPLQVRTESIEWRCSQTLSNMSLSNFCKNSKGCIFWKKDGDTYNYMKYRTPFTPLTPQEEEYCYCDVRGLCECIYSLMEEDTLATIPMTSTGYVRRDFRAVMKANKNNRKMFEKLRLTPDQYRMCKETFRGGNTSSNTLYVGELLHDIESEDLQSSYPAAMLMDKYPMSKFIKVTANSREKFDSWVSRKACLFRVIVDDIHIKDLRTIPYIARSKCLHITDGRFGNGRVLSAKRLVMSLTDIDWKIITDHYTIKGGFVVEEMYIADYDYLPLEFRQHLLSLFTRKCELKFQIKELEKVGKGDSEECKNLEYLYAKFKNKINAAYGMMVTDIASPEIIFELGVWDKCDVNIATVLDKYYTSYTSFLAYQWGVWVTANARKRLQDGLDVIKDDTVYIDTDSIKYRGDHTADFELLNNLHRQKMAECDIDIVVTVNGEKFYIGEWEHDGKYKEFKTQGSKKYIVRDHNGKLKLTLAGVNKEKGARFFEEELHGVDSFEDGVIIPPEWSGRNTAYYNIENIHKLKAPDGQDFTTASNIAIIPTTYELGVTGEYSELIVLIKNGLLHF